MKKDKGAHPATGAPEQIANNTNFVRTDTYNFCSRCAVLGIPSFCEWCWYSNFIQGNFDLVFVGA